MGGGDSGTQYLTCNGSSIEKTGKGSLSFYTAQSQMMMPQSQEKDSGNPALDHTDLEARLIQIDQPMGNQKFIQRSSNK